MTIFAITTLYEKDRSMLKKEENVILNRIWNVYHNFTGKSLNIINDLIETNKVKPNKTVLKMFVQGKK
jgi:hypothetical protein